MKRRKVCGRVSKIENAELREQILKLVRAGLEPRVAAQACGIPEQTWKFWRQYAAGTFVHPKTGVRGHKPLNYKLYKKLMRDCEQAAAQYESFLTGKYTMLSENGKPLLNPHTGEPILNPKTGKPLFEPADPALAERVVGTLLKRRWEFDKRPQSLRVEATASSGEGAGKPTTQLGVQVFLPSEVEDDE